METRNWLVTQYTGDNDIIAAWVIEDRTEHEAQNEAMAHVTDETDDWTMVSADELAEIYLENNALPHKELAELEGFSGGEAAESECLINVGYAWIPKINAWIKKNNILNDERDNAILDYILKTYRD